LVARFGSPLLIIDCDQGIALGNAHKPDDTPYLVPKRRLVRPRRRIEQIHASRRSYSATRESQRQVAAWMCEASSVISRSRTSSGAGGISDGDAVSEHMFV
jgi:hypothetical protein